MDLDKENDKSKYQRWRFCRQTNKQTNKQTNYGLVVKLCYTTTPRAMLWQTWPNCRQIYQIWSKRVWDIMWPKSYMFTGKHIHTPKVPMHVCINISIPFIWMVRERDWPQCHRNLWLPGGLPWGLIVSHHKPMGRSLDFHDGLPSGNST